MQNFCRKSGFSVTINLCRMGSAGCHPKALEPPFVGINFSGQSALFWGRYECLKFLIFITRSYGETMLSSHTLYANLSFRCRTSVFDFSHNFVLLSIIPYQYLGEKHPKSPIYFTSMNSVPEWLQCFELFSEMLNESCEIKR